MKLRHMFGLLLAALFCASFAFAQTAPESPSLLNQGKYVPDIATFLNIGAWGPAGYSWDGKTVFCGSSASGAYQVYRLTDEGWPYQLTAFEDGIDGFTLSYDGKTAVVSASVGGDENSQLYLMDTNTGRLMQITDRPDVQYGSVTWSRDDKYLYFRSNEENLRDFFIYRMNIASGDHVKVFGDSVKTRGSNAISDLSLDGTKMIVSNWKSNVNNDLYLLNLATGKYDHITPHQGDIVYSNTTLLPDNKTVWLTCNDNKDGMARLATMTVGVKKPKIEWVTDGWLDSKWEVEGMGFSRDFKHQVATINEDGYNRLKMREFATKKELPNPPLDGILGVGGSDENGNCLISFSGPTRAPDVWKWNPYTKELKQLTFSIYAGIDRNMFREPQLIRYKSFDGIEIPAFLYLPPDYEKGKPVPFIVDAHGGPESQFQPDFIRNFQYLMLNGYGIIAPNVRGSSGYGRDFLNLDNYKNRKNSLKDYKAGVEWLIANGYTKPGMIGIRGGSYGGYVALGMITEYPDLFSAAIDIVGIANFQTFLQNTASYRRALREAEYGPLTDPEFLKEISPIHKANLIKTPLMVVHGANDPRVPVGEARQILEAVAKNGITVDSLIFADEGHGSGKRVNTIKEYRKHVEFFNRFLKPKPAGEATEPKK
ncbi:S9 family peptidase [candidate division KSB1 bacterium]|nr:MAG: S9 family peptidase [candidate division KSB1 bacterium]